MINLTLTKERAEWLIRLLEMCERQFVQTSESGLTPPHLRGEAELQAAKCLMISNEIQNLLLANG